MKRAIAFVIAMLACGNRPAPAVELPPAPSASIAPVSPHVASGCTAWGSCRALGAPVRVSEDRIGQSPAVAFDGSEALVTYETPREGTHLAAVDMGGRLLWSETIVGTNAQIAWNARSRSGLVVTSETVVWLGRGGKPVHRTNLPPMRNITFHGAVAANGEGFLVASGVGSHATGGQPIAFSVAKIGAPSDAIEWKRVDDDGLRYAPALGPAGDARWLVSETMKNAAQLFSVSEKGAIGAPLRLPNEPSTRVAAVDQQRDATFVLLVDESTHAVSITTARGDKQTPQTDVGITSKRSSSVVVLRVGEQLLIGADKIGDSPGVAIAPFEVAHTLRVGAPLAIGPLNSQHLRAAATDRGFVAVWNIADDAAPLIPLMSHTAMHGLSTMLAVYTCCPAPP